MSRRCTYPPKAHPGDKVAVLSPSAGLPQIFPEVYELGLDRLRKDLELEPVEFPTTRVLGAPAELRARDLHAALEDPEITAIMASIGGDDQITLLRHLDPAVFRANPKPFFGYSDNTNLLNFMWTHGIVGYHGGSVMVHLGRAGRAHPSHLESLRAALFGSGWYELVPPPDWGDQPILWTEPERFGEEPPMWPHEGWTWVNAEAAIEAPTWGGNLEIISWLLQAGFVQDNDAYDGHVLYLETSEEMPPGEEIFRILRNMGERGLLGRFAALVMGRAKAWERNQQNTPEQKRVYIDEQRRAVLRAMEAYHPDAMIVFDVDLGHADPQLIIPNGGEIRLDGPNRRIHVRY
jgi:muramoyltetrapeptide carboxypeptidase LdcA involved in peptidoglycan recycling